MKEYPDDNDFLKQINIALAAAAAQKKRDTEIDNYLQALINLLQNGRGWENTTLRHFLAYWLAMNTNGDWKEAFLDPKVQEAMSIMMGGIAYRQIKDVKLDTESCIQSDPVKEPGQSPSEEVDLHALLRKHGI